MSESVLFPDLERLTVAERILLVEEIWDSIAAKPEDVPVTEAQRRMLDERTTAYLAAPEKVSTWEEVKARIRGSE